MTDSSYSVLDAAGNVVEIKGQKTGEVLTLERVEDAAQRAALIAAFMPLATAAGQGLALAELTAIKTSLQASVDLATTMWTDDSGAFFVRRDVIDQDTGTVTVSFTTPTGAAAAPGAGLRPAANEEALAQLSQVYNVTTTNGGGGYTAGDVIVRQVVLNENAVPPAVVAATWLNLTTGAVIAAPTAGHVVLSSKDLQTAIAASENHLGQVGGQTVVATATPVVSTTAYTAGDVIGVKLQFQNMARLAGGTGMLQMAILQCKSVQTFSCDLVLFHTDLAGAQPADNAPFVLAAGDYDKVAGVIHITDWSNLGGPSLGEAINLAMPYKLPAGSTDLFGVLVARGSPTLSSTSDLKVVVKALLD
ncbi:hypothetical protein [Caulobacter soli]|uniref:hypothetical protein n=1 Tax=Caulobacter soli TaxID=2708539 RepID=UPI0013EB0C7E|nr:hypothetical protein [Caulobacter soli]